MRYTICIIFLSLMTLTCYGQDDRLQPAELAKYKWLKEYNDHLFALLYKKFSDRPFARYTSMPAFGIEYAFSVEKKGLDCVIISSWLSTSLWYSQYDKKKRTVRLRTISSEIDEDLYQTIGELFKVLERQTQKPKEYE